MTRAFFRLICLAVVLTGALAGWLVEGRWATEEVRSVRALKTKAAAPVVVKDSAGQATLDLLRRIATKDLPEKMKLEDIMEFNTGSSRFPMLNEAMRDCLLRELVERDPQAALDASLGSAEGRRKGDLTEQVLGCWLQFDFDAAVAASNNLPASIKSRLSRPFANQVAHANPRKAVELLQSEKLSWVDQAWEKQNLMKRAVLELGVEHPEEALNAAMTYKGKSGRSEFGSTIQPVLTEWYRRDPAGVKRWIVERGDEGDGAAGIAGATAVFSGDPAEGMRLMKEAVRKREELAARDSFVITIWEWQAIAENLTKVNRQAALAQARDLPADDPLRQVLLTSAAAAVQDEPFSAEKLSLLEEAAATAKSETFDNELWRLDGAITRTMEQLAAADPQAALQKARDFPNAPRALAAVLGWLMQNNPSAIPATLTDMLPTPQTAAAVAKLIADQSKDEDNAMAVNTLNQPADYSALLARVPEARALINGAMLANWVAANPAAAANFLAEEIRAGHNPPASQRMVFQWALNDSSAASAWVETLPAGEFRKLAEQNVVNIWRRTDPEAAQAWADRVVKPGQPGAGEK